jgi:hypothetical protein
MSTVVKAQQKTMSRCKCLKSVYSLFDFNMKHNVIFNCFQKKSNQLFLFLLKALIFNIALPIETC